MIRKEAPRNQPESKTEKPLISGHFAYLLGVLGTLIKKKGDQQGNQRSDMQENIQDLISMVTRRRCLNTEQKTGEKQMTAG